MIRNALMAGLAVVAAVALGGCDLYFGSSGGGGGYSYCDETGCYECDDWGCWGTGAQPGDNCRTNYDCAAGCYCDADGTCQESGFCSRDTDCVPGYECDDRSTCVPEGTGDACEVDADCPRGTRCDSGTCVSAPTCTTDSDCAPGQECDGRGTCVPTPCTTDDQCVEGSYCEQETGECVGSGTCTTSEDCDEGMLCDTERNTCVPGEDLPEPPDPGSCGGDLLCNEAPPSCPDGSTPGIADGCYTGYCIPVESCDVPPLTCADMTTAAMCLARPGCDPVYNGINCTGPGGEDCSDPEATDCSCESFEFATCIDSP
jgi:hypothetical protein